MIQLNQRISASLRQSVKDEFENRLNAVDQDVMDGVKKKIFKKVKIIANSHQAYVRDLALHIKVLYSMLIIDKKSTVESLEAFHKRIVATLDYFIDNQDIIPDHLPGEGFLDDALIVNLCINGFPTAQKTRFEKYYQVARK